jgi:O-antigen ligase
MSRPDAAAGPSVVQRWVLLACIALTLLAVLFLVQTNSRSSILIKETAYIVGATVLALALVVLAPAAGLRAACRVGPLQLLPLAAVLLLGPLHMLAGSGSVNTPYNSASLLALAVIALALALFGDRWVRDRLVVVLVAAGGLVCVYALLQWQGVEVFRWDQALARSGRVSGSLGNPNLMGSLAAVLPVVAVGWMLYRKLPAVVLVPVSAVAVAVSALAIVASGTRGSLIGLGAGFVVLLGLQAARIGRRKLLLIGLLLLLGVLLVFFPMRGRFEELAGGDGGTLTVRRVIWSGAFRAFLDRPLAGWGPGSFQKVFPAYRDPAYHLMGVSHNTLHAHCEYLELLLDTGLVGALLWAGLAAALVARRRRWRMDPLAAGLAAAVAALLAEGLVSVALRWAPSAMLLSLLVGLLMIDGRQEGLAWKRVRLPLALPALVPAALLGLSLPMYLGGMEAGKLLFQAKNVHLTRSEPEMNRACSIASRWAATGEESLAARALDRWRTGRMAADSAIHYCELCLEANPSDLGGWYALGSSYLTRAIVANPNSVPMSRLLERRGSLEVDTGVERVMTEKALEAYRHLRSLAPNYAEVHNNLALVHTRLDNLDSAMVYMHNAYMLHAHRRADYFMQICDLGPLLDSDRAWRVYLSHHIPDLEAMGRGEESRMSGQLTSILNTVAFMVQRYPSRADSLARMAAEIYRRRDLEVPGDGRKEALLDLARRETMALRADSLLLAGDTVGARSLLDSVPPGEVSPGMALPVVRARAGAGGPQERIDALSEYLWQMVLFYRVHLGRTQMGLRPFEDLERLVVAGSETPGWWDPLRSATVLMLYADRELADLCELARGQFSRSTADSVAALLQERWRGVGGPRYCSGTDRAVPWLQGGMIHGLSRALDSLCAGADTWGGFAEEAHMARIELAYMMLSTQMWTGPYMAQSQVDSLISWAAPSVRLLADSLGGERYTNRICRRFRLVDEALLRTVPVANRTGMEALRGWFSDPATAGEGAPEPAP